MNVSRIFRRTNLAAAIAALALGSGAAGYHFAKHPPALAALVPVSAAHAVSAPIAQIAIPDFAALAESRGPAVVNITIEQRNVVAGQSPNENPFEGMPFGEFFRFYPRPDAAPGQALGSGFFISADGYLLTNAHVVGDAKKVKVRLTDRREFDARVIGLDKATDVALAKVDATGLPFVVLGDPKGLRVGEWVVAIGSPYGFENSVTAGIVSAKGRSLPDDTYVPFIQTDVAVNPGNSGGPLFNLKGEAVGINSQIYSRSGGYQGLSFAIPIDVAQNVVTQLKTSGHVARGWLGVSIQSVSHDLARSFGMDKPRGALVSSVSEYGPARAAGLKPGDVIVSYEGKPIDSASELPLAVGATVPGARAKIEVIREGKPKTLQLNVGTLPTDEKVRLGADEPAEGAKLNVTVSELTLQQKKLLGVDHGLLVQEVAAGAAARAGVRSGDVILQIDGKPVDNVAALRAALSGLPKDRPAAVLVKRGEGTLFLPLEPAARSVG
jgi:serine protease Do